MVKVQTYEDALDLMERAMSGKIDWRLIDLYNWIVDRGMGDALDCYINHEFPDGTDEDEYLDFFRNHWADIADELNFEYRADSPVVYHVTDIEWDADDEELGETDVSTNFAPEECEVEVYERNCDLDDVIANKLSDEYGYCVKGFNYERKVV